MPVYADLAGSFLGGYRSGASSAEAQANLQERANQAALSIGMEQQKLAQEQQQTQLTLTLRQQQLAKENQMEQQKLAVTQAYHDATIGLRKQQLQDAHEKLQMATQAASSKLMAQRNYENNAQEFKQQLMQQGMPEREAEQEAYTRSAMKFGPMMGLTGSALGAALRPKPSYGELQTTTLPGGYTGVSRPGSPGFKMIPPRKATIPLSALASAAKAIPELQSGIQMEENQGITNGPSAKVYSAIQNAIQSQVGEGAGALSAVPWPGSKQAKPGVTYSKGRKSYIWDGQKAWPSEGYRWDATKGKVVAGE